MRRRHRRLKSEPDLDITPFMNLMIVLVPVLLLNMVFAHTSVLELNFPTGDNITSEQAEALQIQVVIHIDRLVVENSEEGVIKAIAKTGGGYDFGLLKEVMKDLKSRMPDKKDVVILPSQSISYQTLITVMDTVRSYDVLVAGNLVDAELFPDVSLGEAPIQGAEEAGSRGGQI